MHADDGTEVVGLGIRIENDVRFRRSFGQQVGEWLDRIAFVGAGGVIGGDGRGYLAVETQPFGNSATLLAQAQHVGLGGLAARHAQHHRLHDTIEDNAVHLAFGKGHVLAQRAHHEERQDEHRQQEYGDDAAKLQPGNARGENFGHFK